MGSDNVKIIRNEINKKGYSWFAGPTSISKLPLEKRKMYLGLAISEAELNRIGESIAAEEARSDRRAPIYPATWNWRSVLGQDWTTEVKDQGVCGSCVAFATVSMIESNLKIFKRDPSFMPDLSEADLFFRGCGHCCVSGWSFVPALRYAQSSGIPDEACFPYDGTTVPCPNRDTRVVKIKSWRRILITSQAKEWISSKGPIMTGMNVFNDFFYYLGGIYRYTHGDYIGNHAICIVGYDDANSCWICKNSWGLGWGESGWFKIAYGECGIGRRFGYYSVQFTDDDDIVMPKDGRAFVRLKRCETAFNDEVRLYYPENKAILPVVSANIGKLFEAGNFRAGTRLIFALKTSEGYTYYTDQLLNIDAADHVSKVQTGTYKWELRWEDILGLGEQDYNDVVMEVEIFNKSPDDIVMPRDGHVFVRLKSKRTSLKDQFLQCSPKYIEIFDTSAANIGTTIDLGEFMAGDTLTFALKTQEGYTYYAGKAVNPDSCTHVKKLATNYNKWELRWSDRYMSRNRDYKDLVIEVEVIP